MPRAKKAEVPAQPTIARTASERGVPIKEYALRVRASQSASMDRGLIKARVADALENQGYPFEEIRDVLKTL